MADLTYKARYLLIVQSICLAISSLVIFLRLGTKPCIKFIEKRKERMRLNKYEHRALILSAERKQKTELSADDVFMYIAFLLYLVQSVAAIYGIVAGGIGVHAAGLNLSKITIAAKMWYICEAVNGPLSASIRISVSLYLLRLIPITDSIGSLCRTRTAVITGLSAMVIFTFFYTSMNVFQCNPPDYYWKQFQQYQHGASCRLSRAVPPLAMVHSGISAGCDFAIAALSYKVTRKIQIKLLKRVGIFSLLSLGIVAGITMVIRTFFIKMLEISTDFLYETVDVAMWSIIEPSLGIVAGCLPTAYSLYLAIVRRNDHLTVATPNRNNSRSGTISAKAQSGNEENGCFSKFRSLYLTIVRNDDRSAPSPAPSPASSQSTLGNICVTKTLEVMRTEKGEEDVDSGKEFGCTAWVRSSATPGPFGPNRT